MMKATLAYWVQFQNDGLEKCGFIPDFLDNHDARSAREQLNANYAHGGGWVASDGWAYSGDGSIERDGFKYLPLAATILRDETVFVYPAGWVAILQMDLSLEVARMD
tara:strand:+ start:324 stop:644 length:321 start_codon:yes stop_codon:yes gene_type:complete